MCALYPVPFDGAIVEEESSPLSEGVAELSGVAIPWGRVVGGFSNSRYQQSQYW